MTFPAVNQRRFVTARPAVRLMEMFSALQLASSQASVSSSRPESSARVAIQNRRQRRRLLIGSSGGKSARRAAGCFLANRYVRGISTREATQWFHGDKERLGTVILMRLGSSVLLPVLMMFAR